MLVALRMQMWHRCPQARQAAALYSMIAVGQPAYLFQPEQKNRDYALRNLSRQFDQLLRLANLKEAAGGESRTLYSLRHTCIMNRLIKGDNISLLTLARSARTSVEMIDRFYAKHLTAEMNIEQLQSNRFDRDDDDVKPSKPAKSRQTALRRKK